MARPRQKLDRLQQGETLQKQLKEEPPGARRERLMAVQLGLMGEQSLEQIAAAVGRARSTIQEWFGRYRKGGVELLLDDGRAENRGAEGLLDEGMKEQFEAGLDKGLWRTAPQIQQWLSKAVSYTHLTLPTIYSV